MVAVILWAATGVVSVPAKIVLPPILGGGIPGAVILWAGGSSGGGVGVVDVIEGTWTSRRRIVGAGTTGRELGGR